MIVKTQLAFDILESNSCKTINLLDASVYNPSQVISNPTLQVITPFDDVPVELIFYKNAITILNSNLLGITNVDDLDYLQELPDGLYTAKISICPEDQFYCEKSWFRTCQLECKYDKAFIKLNITPCDACFSPEKLKKLERAKMYLYGAKVNAKNSNNKEAQKLYNASSKIINNLLECDC